MKLVLQGEIIKEKLICVTQAVGVMQWDDLSTLAAYYKTIKFPQVLLEPQVVLL